VLSLKLISPIHGRRNKTWGKRGLWGKSLTQKRFGIHAKEGRIEKRRREQKCCGGRIESAFKQKRNTGLEKKAYTINSHREADQRRKFGKNKGYKTVNQQNGGEKIAQTGKRMKKRKLRGAVQFEY